MKLGQVRLGKVSIAVKTFGVCDFSRLAVTDWRLRILALMTATLSFNKRPMLMFCVAVFGLNCRIALGDI